MYVSGNKNIIAAIAVVGVLLALYAALYSDCDSSVVYFNKSQFRVSEATTTASRELGLSGRAQLASNEGMLFMFDDANVRHFWMKGMNFPLDIVWMDEEFRVSGMVENAAPDSYPTAFASPPGVRYVLEIGAGGARREAIATGTKARFVHCDLR